MCFLSAPIEPYCQCNGLVTLYFCSSNSLGKGIRYFASRQVVVCGSGTESDKLDLFSTAGPLPFVIGDLAMTSKHKICFHYSYCFLFHQYLLVLVTNYYSLLPSLLHIVALDTLPIILTAKCCFYVCCIMSNMVAITNCCDVI